MHWMTVASHLTCCPAQSCRAPVASFISVPMVVRIVFQIMWQITFPIPMGLNPGQCN